MIWLIVILIDSLINHWFITGMKWVPIYWILNTVRLMVAVVYGAAVLHVEEQDFWWFIAHVALPYAFLFNSFLATWRKRHLDVVGEHSGIIDPLIFKYKLQRPYWWFTLTLFCVWIRFFMTR